LNLYNLKFVSHPRIDRGEPFSTLAGLLGSGDIRGSFDVGNITLYDLVFLAYHALKVNFSLSK